MKKAAREKKMKENEYQWKIINEANMALVISLLRLCVFS